MPQFELNQKNSFKQENLRAKELKEKPVTVDAVQPLAEALEAKDNLKAAGDLMYKNFKGPDYSTRNILGSIKEVYDQKKFEPKLTFEAFVQSFGPGLVKLCQQKLVEEGYDLGKFGKKNDGVDGKWGKRTANALRDYYGEDVPKPAAVESKNSNRAKIIIEEPVLSVSGKPIKENGYEIAPNQHLSPKEDFKPVILNFYKEHPHEFDSWNLEKQFGGNQNEVMHYITNVDPITGQPLTFLGKPIHGGMNLIAIPFFKMAEEELLKNNVNYKPMGKDVGGFDYRNIGKTPQPSFHKVGLAFDVDASENFPDKNRGTIPNEVIMAMVHAGFAWGSIATPDANYLQNDSMHFQLRVNPSNDSGQGVINASPYSEIGKKYWEAIKPKLEKIEADKAARNKAK